MIHITLLNICKSNIIWYNSILKKNTKNDKEKGIVAMKIMENLWQVGGAEYTTVEDAAIH